MQAGTKGRRNNNKVYDLPMRVRRRQSDARWRANVASCFETLKNIIPVNKRASKRQISKAFILQETSKHLNFLEGILATLLQEKGAVEAYEDDWSRTQFEKIQQEFIDKQKKKLEALNNERRYKRNKYKLFLPCDTVDTTPAPQGPRTAPHPDSHPQITESQTTEKRPKDASTKGKAKSKAEGNRVPQGRKRVVAQQKKHARPLKHVLEKLRRTEKEKNKEAVFASLRQVISSRCAPPTEDQSTSKPKRQSARQAKKCPGCQGVSPRLSSADTGQVRGDPILSHMSPVVAPGSDPSPVFGSAHTGLMHVNQPGLNPCPCAPGGPLQECPCDVFPPVCPGHVPLDGHLQLPPGDYFIGTGTWKIVRHHAPILVHGVQGRNQPPSLLPEKHPEHVNHFVPSGKTTPIPMTSDPLPISELETPMEIKTTPLDMPATPTTPCREQEDLLRGEHHFDLVGSEILPDYHGMVTPQRNIETFFTTPDSKLRTPETSTPMQHCFSPSSRYSTPSTQTPTSMPLPSLALLTPVKRGLPHSTPDRTPLIIAPIEQTPIKGTPVRGTPVRGTPVRGTPVKGTPVQTTPIFHQTQEDESPSVGFRQVTLPYDWLALSTPTTPERHPCPKHAQSGQEDESGGSEEILHCHENISSEEDDLRRAGSSRNMSTSQSWQHYESKMQQGSRSSLDTDDKLRHRKPRFTPSPRHSGLGGLKCRRSLDLSMSDTSQFDTSTNSQEVTNASKDSQNDTRSSTSEELQNFDRYLESFREDVDEDAQRKSPKVTQKSDLSIDSVLELVTGMSCPQRPLVNDTRSDELLRSLESMEVSDFDGSGSDDVLRVDKDDSDDFDDILPLNWDLNATDEYVMMSDSSSSVESDSRTSDQVPDIPLPDVREVCNQVQEVPEAEPPGNTSPAHITTPVSLPDQLVGVSPIKGEPSEDSMKDEDSVSVPVGDGDGSSGEKCLHTNQGEEIIKLEDDQGLTIDTNSGHILGAFMKGTDLSFSEDIAMVTGGGDDSGVWREAAVWEVTPGTLEAWRQQRIDWLDGDLQ